MAYETKIRKIGNSYGIVIPKEALASLRVQEGDTVCLTDGAENSLHMVAGKAGFPEKMAVVDSLIRRYRNALRELAK